MSAFEPAAGEPDTARATRAELDRLAELDLDEHPDVYERVHADLQRALAAIDDA
jgi:hypothetical protein